MEKKKIELIITIGLCVVFILALSNSIRKIKSKFAAPIQQAVPEAEQPQQQLKAPLDVSVKDDDAQWVRDPFSGKIYSGKEEIIDLRLSGIIWDAQNPRALINDSVVGEGGSIGQFKVIKIFKDKVQLGIGNRTFEIKLPQ